MKVRLIAVLAAAIVAGGPVGGAQAQERIEAGNQGYRGGYSNFGGYYDTFGGFGGYSGYGGYRRFEGGYGPTTSIFAIPLYGPSDSAKACDYFHRRASETGARKWKARYEACRRGN